MIRHPAVAGAFYPGDRARLESVLETYVSSSESIEGVVAAVAPHAGYEYSGPAAGALFASIEMPETVVVLGPNHRGLGAPYGLFEKGAWQTPLGEAAIDEEFAARLMKEADFLESDSASHIYEHSIEVQVPFLQYCRAGVKIVPVSIGEHDYGKLMRLAAAIAGTAEALGSKPLVLASSDMSHYETAENASRMDRVAIERMLALDEEGLWEEVSRRGITMCGVAPAVIAIAAGKAMGADAAKLVMYNNSGDATGDFSQVVGYASLGFYRETE